MNFLLKIRYLKNNETIINGSLFSLFSFINRGFSFLLLLILANYILPAEYGYLNLFGTVVMLVGYFIALSTEGYLSVSFFRENFDALKQTFSCILYTGIVVAIIVLALLLAFGHSISTKLDLPLQSLFYAIGISFCTIISNIFLDYQRLKKRVWIYGLFSCGNALLNFIISIYFVKFLIWGWEGRVYAQFTCCVLFGIMGLLFFLKKRFFVFPNINHWKMMLLWAIPLIPHLATTFIRQGCDRYIINYYHTINDVGLFSFSLTLANIIIMIGIGFNQSNSVDIYSVLGNEKISAVEKKAKLKRQRKNIFIIYLLSAILVTIVCVVLIPIVLPKYSLSMKYFPLLAIYAFFNCLYFLYTNFLFFYKKTKNLMAITFGSSLFHLIMSLLLTQYSLYYTCGVYIASQFMICIIVRRQMNNLLKEYCK